MTLDTFLALRRCAAVIPSPDGRSVVVAVQRLDEKGARFVSDLWRVPTDGGDAERLTRGDHGASSPWFRADGALGFLAKRPKGDERPDEAVPQVWLLPAGGGEAFALTDEPLGVSEFAFAGDTLATWTPVLPGVPHADQAERSRDLAKHGPSAVRYTKMPVRHWDHWLGPSEPHLVVRRADGTDRRDLTPDAGDRWRDTSWDLSPDGARIAAVRRKAGQDRLDDGVFVEIDVATGAATTLAEEPRASWGAPRYSPDGDALAALVWRRSPDRGPTTEAWVSPARSVNLPADLAPDTILWRGDGLLCVGGALRGRHPVFDSDGRVLLADATFAALASRPGDPRLFGLRSTFLAPPEPFVADDAGVRMLAPLSGGAATDLVVDEMEVPGEDGALVHAFVVRPAGPGPHPALVWIHGGPIGAHADSWHWRWNARLAAEAGYVVCLPNPRGSTGYGQTFVDGIWGNTWGAACYTDLLAVTDALCARPEVDPRRVAAMGGSFGGYMVNWIGGNTDRFAALVSHASVFDFATFQGTTDSPDWWRLQIGTTAWSDAEGLARYSPSRLLPRWKTPTLVLHGEKDYRCPVSEGLALFDALQLHGVPSELVVFPDENHWITKPRNVRAWNEAWMAFVGRHLAR